MLFSVRIRPMRPLIIGMIFDYTVQFFLGKRIYISVTY